MLELDFPHPLFRGAEMEGIQLCAMFENSSVRNAVWIGDSCWADLSRVF